MNREVFFKVSYGLYVVSSASGGRVNGYVANTVFKVTSKPARFAVACNKDNYTCRLIRESLAFAVSVLRQDASSETIGLFGYQSGSVADKYASVKHRIGRTGAPILLQDTLAWFECNVTQTLDTGTHQLFIGEVVDGDVLDDAAAPLSYAYYRDVKKGKAPKNAPTYIEPAKEEPVSAAPQCSPKYVCPVCGYVYDPAEGDPDAGVPPGTHFAELPEDWVCPVCGARKSEFVRES